MARKPFCIMTQSGTVGDPLTVQHQQQFNTELSDYWRLNWRTRDDPDAHWHVPNTTYSEGRSILFELVPKQYDYYIFIDDDLEFATSGGDPLVAPAIVNFLERWRPLSGAFYSESWHNGLLVPTISGPVKEAFPFMGVDLEAMILQADVAQALLPVTYHGNWGCMWYIHYLIHRFAPAKQIVCGTVQIRNSRNTPFKPHNHLERDVLAALFNEGLHARDFPLQTYHERVKETNRDFYAQDADPRPAQFGLAELATLYDINRADFRARRPLRV